MVYLACMHSDNQPISQSVDFYSGLSGAATARTTSWMMSVDDVSIWLDILAMESWYVHSVPVRPTFISI